MGLNYPKLKTSANVTCRLSQSQPWEANQAPPAALQQRLKSSHPQRNTKYAGILPGVSHLTTPFHFLLQKPHAGMSVTTRYLSYRRLIRDVGRDSKRLLQDEGRAAALRPSTSGAGPGRAPALRDRPAPRRGDSRATPEPTRTAGSSPSLP